MRKVGHRVVAPGHTVNSWLSQESDPSTANPGFFLQTVASRPLNLYPLPSEQGGSIASPKTRNTHQPNLKLNQKPLRDFKNAYILPIFPFQLGVD